MVDLLTTWLAEINNIRGTNLRKSAMIDYKIQNLVPVEYAKQCMELIRKPNFFRDLDPLPGAIEGYKKLRELPGVDVQICTHPAGKHSAFGKYEWCEKWLGIDEHEITMTTMKSEFDADIVIDDSPKVLRNFLSKSWDKSAHSKALHLLSIQYPYNRNVPAAVEFMGSYEDTESAWENIVSRVIEITH